MTFTAQILSLFVDVGLPTMCTYANGEAKCHLPDGCQRVNPIINISDGKVSRLSENFSWYDFTVILGLSIYQQLQTRPPVNMLLQWVVMKHCISYTYIVQYRLCHKFQSD